MSKTTNKYSPEERERAVRLVLDSEAGSCPREWCSSTEPSARLRALNSAVAAGLMAVAIDLSSGEAWACDNRPTRG